MSNWSKEDRLNYQKSEVFQELEKLTIANIYRLELLQKKAVNLSQMKQTINEIGTAAKSAAPAIRELNKLINPNLTNGSDDQLSDMAEDEELGKGLSELDMKRIEEEHAQNISDSIVNELMEMKEAAIKEGNIKLAYKIERTLDEILSVETT